MKCFRGCFLLLFFCLVTIVPVLAQTPSRSTALQICDAEDYEGAAASVDASDSPQMAHALRTFANFQAHRFNVRVESGEAIFSMVPPYRPGKVWVTGDFDGWSGEVYFFEEAGRGRLEARVPLGPGRYRYQFRRRNEPLETLLLAPDSVHGVPVFQILPNGTLLRPDPPSFDHRVKRAFHIFRMAEGECGRKLAQKEAAEILAQHPSSADAFHVWVQSHLDKNGKLPQAIAGLPGPEFAKARGYFLSGNSTLDPKLRYSMHEEAYREGLRGPKLTARLAQSQTDHSLAETWIRKTIQDDPLSYLAESRLHTFARTPEGLQQLIQFAETTNAFVAHEALASHFALYKEFNRSLDHAHKAAQAHPLQGVHSAHHSLYYLRLAGEHTRDTTSYETALIQALKKWPNAEKLHSHVPRIQFQNPQVLFDILTKESSHLRPGPSRLSSIAYLHSQMGRHQIAENTYRTAVQSAPEWMELKNRWIDVLQKNHHTKEALSILREMEHLGSVDSNYYLKRADLELEEGNFAKARLYYEKAYRKSYKIHATNTSSVQLRIRAIRQYRKLSTPEESLQAVELGQGLPEELENLYPFSISLEELKNYLPDILAVASESKDASPKNTLKACYKLLNRWQETLHLGFNVLLVFYLMVLVLGLVLCRLFQRVTLLGSFFKLTVSFLLFLYFQFVGTFLASHFLFGSAAPVLLEPSKPHGFLAILLGYAASALFVIGMGRLLFQTPRRNHPLRFKDAMLGIPLGATLQILNLAVFSFFFSPSALNQFFGQTHSIAEGMTALSGNPAGLAALILTLIAIAAWTEEQFFRGILIPYLRERGGVGPAIFLSGFLFGVIHFVHIGPTMILGWLLGWLYVKSDNLWLPFFTHASFNGTAILLALGTAL